MELLFKAADTKKRYKITKIYVREGGAFQAGDPLLKAESGKLNTVVKAECPGTIETLLTAEGNEIGNGEAFARAVCGEEDAAPVTAAGKAGAVPGSVAPNSSSAPKTPSPALSLFGKKETLTCDLAVIGAGPGGYEAAIYAAKQGKNVVLIEKGKVGGTCLNVGCIPTKAIVNSAETYHMLRSLERVGIGCGPAAYDMHRVIGHKNQVVEQLRGGIESLLEANHVRLVKGTASFQSDREILAVQDVYKRQEY